MPLRAAFDVGSGRKAVGRCGLSEQPECVRKPTPDSPTRSFLASWESCDGALDTIDGTGIAH
jgi:hypothetical protein